MNKKYNIYCEESCHLLNPYIKPMAIGCIWCPSETKDEAFRRLREIKIKNGLSSRCELKWNAVSPSKLDYYLDVLNYFFDNQNLHFRVLIVPDKTVLELEKYNLTYDQFYYRSYYNLLKTLIEPSCNYAIYLDVKDTQGAEKVKKLHEVLACSQYDFNKKIIKKIQQVSSEDVELIGLADFLMGAVIYNYRQLNTSASKMQIIEIIKNKTGYSLTQSTLFKEDKFNIFVWKSKGDASWQ